MAKQENSKKSPKIEEIVEKSEIALAEEGVLDFWRERNIFQKSLDKQSRGGDRVFYDGPPFATGLPHHGHILVSVIKDAVPRYWTMRGFHVERRWGWDCHGLPVENIVEKDLGVSGHKEIEALGVDKFNEYARSKVLGFVDQWKETVERIGRWVDFDGSYKTMDNTFIESVWWALKELWDKKLIYEGTRVLPYCPRCETPIANSEIAMDNSYKDISDISVYVKLELTDFESGKSNAKKSASEKSSAENLPTFLIVWTTTPWTLPGNTAAAVNSEIDYVKVRLGNEYYIVAKSKVGIFKEQLEIVSEFKGSELVGKSYKPPYDFFYKKDKNILNKENGWKVYDASYVTTETGTGIVHLAPGYGEEDMALAIENKIPFVLHVGSDGKFTNDLSEKLSDGEAILAGLHVKPKKNHQSADKLIVADLKNKGILFAEEEIVHSYPHCFRCETPLYYFALRAWFIRVQESKKQTLALNEKINWVPAHLKHGRFGKGIESAPDWNISRNRYWASPLPFWNCAECGKVECVGSLEEIKKRRPAKNNFFVMRHGEAEHNLSDIVSSKVDAPNHLTEQGKKQVLETAKKLKGEKIDLIIASDFLRTKETAEIIASSLDLPSGAVIYDERLREIKAGDLEGKTWDQYHDFFTSNNFSRFEHAPVGGETLTDLQKRVLSALFDAESVYNAKNILIISHGAPLFFLDFLSEGKSQADIKKAFVERRDQMSLGGFRKIPFTPFPHDKNFALDFHRPYIDEITFPCSCGGLLRRTSEVIDCWFESGSMPFAPHHYPFENKEKFEKNFPAKFIVEYIAQTRTWFYYTHTISSLLFNSNAFENVLSTGTVLAEDGQKMSKSKANFANPANIYNKYGVDALRFYLLSSPLMKSEDLNFTEKGVDEIYKKIILRLKNVVSFYELSQPENPPSGLPKLKNILDRWVVSRLNSTIKNTTEAMEAYEIDRALAPVNDFLEDLSVWYIRRSRDRLKGDDEEDKAETLHTLFYVLLEFSKTIAPFMPFIAETTYKKIGGDKISGLESIHLDEWPTGGEVDETLLVDMAEVRTVVGLALEARARAGIKVRQPLAKLFVKELKLKGKDELIKLIAEEVNVKSVVFEQSISSPVELDTKITPELQDEGNLRDLIRAIQNLRKENNLKAGEAVSMTVFADQIAQDFVKRFEKNISKTATISKINFSETSVDGAGEEILAGEMKFVIALNK